MLHNAVKRLSLRLNHSYRVLQLLLPLPKQARRLLSSPNDTAIPLRVTRKAKMRRT